MNDTELMQKIKAEFGALIAATCQNSSIPESFIAALIANESGGDPDAKRFEPAVFGSLAQVLLGRKKNYGSFVGDDISKYVFPEGFAVDPANSADLPGATRTAGILALQRLASLATSQGIVQIMGYQAIVFRLNSAEDLADPATALKISIKMLGQFSARWGLDVTKDFSELFDCWNTGRPTAPTADPQYIPNGLARKAIYEALP